MREGRGGKVGGKIGEGGREKGEVRECESKIN